MAAAVFAGSTHAAEAQTFATSFESGQPAPETTRGALQVAVTGGPAPDEVLTDRPGVGFRGTHALRYGVDANAASGRLRTTLARTRLRVGPHTRLSYLVFPVAAHAAPPSGASFVAVDLVFADGRRLSATPAVEQHGVAARAAAIGRGRVLYVNQWNRIEVDLGTVAKGRTVTAVELVVDTPPSLRPFHGYLDDVAVRNEPAVREQAPSEYVDTRRGSHANGHFSRGNTFPAVALPHGFNFWTPTTHAGSDWIYSYQERNGADNRPRLEALALSHEPSPWMGDRQTFQVMPAAVEQGAPPLDRERRALGFDHADEIARPYLYRVHLDGGIVAEMAPTDRAAMLRFAFPGPRGQLVFDNRDDRGGITLDPEHANLHGYSDVASRLSTGATRLFFYATFDRAVAESGRLTGRGRDHVAAWFGFDTSRDKTVHMRIATSLISVEQARRNLEMEIPRGTRFGEVVAQAKRRWDALLGKVEIPGASRRDKVNLYSNLYRLFLYPNEAFENVGTAAQPEWRYASPFSPPLGTDTPEHTGARVEAGRPYVNNGFWDTYRTAWPAYALLTPRQAGAMIDGFVQQYRDAGWIARWSSPGFADLMVGTSADVAFADAWLKGVRNFDVRSFYQAALKDATVVSPIAGTGRKGLQRSAFRGYVDTDTDEGLSWSMAGYLNDFGIARLAAALARQPPAGDPYAGHYADDARYLGSRARQFPELFDAHVGFFVGRRTDGRWRAPAGQFDPKRWGGDYTETNAWNMAFEGVQDPRGLAALYGGRSGLARKLDAFFAAGGDFDVGSYGGVIHEMLEAREVRMGQYGHSNQPSHHILYLYDLAGQPWKTQDKVRDALRRLYTGSAIGQGYPGDEDNGEMSAWYLFSAAGFYPLRVGTPTYAIGAPYFPHMIIHLDGGRRIDIRAPGVSDRNRYIQSLTVNGVAHDSVWLRHADLARGARLEFRMGPKPSSWGRATGMADVPAPRLLDQAARGRVRVQADGLASARSLWDDTSDTGARLPAHSTGIVLHALDRPRQVAMYTLTSSAQAGADPSGWVLEGSRDGRTWQVLDRRTDQRFPWRRQTRAFAVAHPGRYAWYRWRPLDADGAVDLAEIEWLGPASSPSR